MAGLKRRQTLLLLRCYMKRGSFLEYFTHVPDVQSSFSKKQSKGLKIWSFVRRKRAAFTERSQCLKEQKQFVHIDHYVFHRIYILFLSAVLTTFKPKKKPILKPPLFHILAVNVSWR